MLEFLDGYVVFAVGHYAEGLEPSERAGFGDVRVRKMDGLSLRDRFTLESRCDPRA